MKAVFYDLDGTLFDVEQYFRGAFMLIGEHLESFGLEKEKTKEDLLLAWRRRGSMYPTLLTDYLQIHGLSQHIKEVVKLFHSYRGEIAALPGAHEMLVQLKAQGTFLGIITDGNAARQRWKITALDFEPLLDAIIITDELGERKPSIRPFKEAINRLDRNDYVLFYVGDNPFVDFAGAKKCHFKTIRIRRGEFADVPDNDFIDYEFEDIDGVKRFLLSYG